jgi:hypothetical protein
MKCREFKDPVRLFSTYGVNGVCSRFGTALLASRT